MPDDADVDSIDETAEDTSEILDEIERKRSLRGFTAVLVAAVGVSFSAYQMWIAARGYRFRFTLPFAGEVELASFQQLQINSIHVAFALVLAFLLYPPSTGEGRVARRLAAVADAAESRLGEDSGGSRALRRLRGFVRWAAVDSEMRRVTPVDAVLVVLALLPPLYTATQFDEISNRLRVRGLGAGRTLGDVVPPLSFLEFGPLAEYSLAFILGVIGILLVLEATRRALGVLLTALVSLFIVYARVGYLIPRDMAGVGVFAITPTPWSSIVRDLWYNTEAGIFGVPVTVSVRFIYIFILFGAFLEMSGAGKWFIDLAYSITGTKRGGPAKASVVSSGFMGMLSGSSVANTVTTGAFTIPLMKRSGYTPEFSGAVESSVSSGGQILPPVMGAAAFLIVEYTNTPYRQVIVAAALPALAFFFGMWVMVHFEAVRRGVGGVDRSALLDIRPHLKRGWFYLAPIALLVYFLVVARLSVGRSGWFTILATVALIALVSAYDERTRLPLVGALTTLFAGTVATQYLAGVTLTEFVTGARGEGLALGEAVVASFGGFALVLVVVSFLAMFLRPDADPPLLDLDPAVDDAAERIDSALGRDAATTRPGKMGAFVLKAMDNGARTAVVVVVAVAAAGIIPGVISVTGLGPNLTRLIILVSGESLLLLLVLSGIAAIILGMGMPTTVMYIILVSVMGGALEEFGVALIAAHLYVLYLGLMADVTPPVMVAAYAAAGVAKAEAFETGKLAFMLSLNKILVPFAFVYAPGLLLVRDWDNSADTLQLVSLSDLLDPGYLVPEVLVPVVGVFAGVYALGVTIIGYRTTRVSSVRRVLYGLSSVLLTVPALFTTLLGAAVTVESQSVETLALRTVGAALLVGLVLYERRTEREPSATEKGTSA